MDDSIFHSRSLSYTRQRKQLEKRGLENKELVKEYEKYKTDKEAELKRYDAPYFHGHFCLDLGRVDEMKTLKMLYSLRSLSNLI